MDYIRSEMDFGNYIDMVMIDFQKAFDTVDLLVKFDTVDS